MTTILFSCSGHFRKETEMGVKHSVDLTRLEAEQKFIDMVFKEKAYMIDPPIMVSNAALAYILEILNDHENRGEGFENYRIVP